MRMPFIPEARYEIRTRLTPEEVCAALKENTAAVETPFRRNQFLGTVGRTAFCIRAHNPSSKTLFKPELWGKIREDGGASVVSVEAKLGLPVKMIPVFLLAAGVISGIYGLLLLIPLYYWICNMSFRLEEDVARRRLTRLIEK